MMSGTAFGGILENRAETARIEEREIRTGKPLRNCHGGLENRKATARIEAEKAGTVHVSGRAARHAKSLK